MSKKKTVKTPREIPVSELTDEQKKEQYKFAFKEKNSKFTEECLSKLEHAFSIGGDISMACFYANISRQTYYNWIEEFPGLLDRFEELRQKVPLKALENISDGVHKGDILLSERVLARRYPNEHADPIRVQHNMGTDGISEEDKAVVDELHARLKENRLKRSKEKAKQDGELK